MTAPSLRLYVFRHGETDFNRQNILQGGGIDMPLNEKGLYQANRFYQAYRHIPFDTVVASGLTRAQQTVAPFEQEGHQIIRLPGLNEINWGTIEGQPIDAAIEAEIHKANQEWASGNLDYRVAGGESPREVWARVHDALMQVFSQQPHGNILMCVHGRILRILIAELIGEGMQHMMRYPHQNTGLNILLKSDPHFIAEALNNVSHLHD